MEASSDNRGWRERAEEHFARREFRASHEAALEGLSADPDDLDALRLAGRSGVEIEADDAVAHLQRAAELAPDDVDSWRDLGDALAAEGRTAEAEEAWKKLAALRPDDSMVLTSLGHAALAAGHSDEAAERLTAAAEADARNLSASMSLVDVYRDMGQFPQALAIAQRIWETDPEAVLSGLDVAELSVVRRRLRRPPIRCTTSCSRSTTTGTRPTSATGSSASRSSASSGSPRSALAAVGGAAGAVRALPAPARLLRRPRDRVRPQRDLAGPRRGAA